MMQTLIILNGECKSYEFLKELAEKSDYIICADGGYLHAEKCGIVPDLVLGDFDSCDEPCGVKTLKFSSDKDFTDGEIAVNEAKKAGSGNIVITCALGGRPDQEMGNYMLLNNGIKIQEPFVDIYGVKDETVVLSEQGKTFSIIPVTKSTVTVNKSKYPLNEKEIKWGSSLTLSNVFYENNAEIKVKGHILLFVNK